ncbi:MAG TPA: alpha/beta hydrolase [Gemmatimonadales bacterium]|nr:alpha/beta hydrolase [Gemmatimonadales bacterium]
MAARRRARARRRLDLPALSAMLALLLALAAADTGSVAVRQIAVAPAETLRVTLSGTGRPVVLVTGLIGSAYNYRQVVPALHRHGLRTVVIEPLGVGYSSRPGKADYSYTAQGDRIGAVLDTLGLHRVPIVAHAGSASMVLRLAVRRPELVDRILLIQGIPDEVTATSAIKKAVKFRFLIKLFAGRGRIKKEVRQGFVEASGDTTWITPEVIDSYTAGPAGDIGAVFRVLTGMTRAVEPDSITNNLWRIQVPVRLLYGDARAQGVPRSKPIALMQQRLPHFQVDTVHGAGVHLHEERPDAVVASILDWLGEPTGAPHPASADPGTGAAAPRPDSARPSAPALIPLAGGRAAGPSRTAPARSATR